MINLMIADDNVEFVQQLSYMLTKEKDFKIINISYNGLEAIKNFKDLKPDVLLLDLEMPLCSGIDVLEQIQNDNNNVIIISGSDKWRLKVQDTSKFNWMLPKPVDYPKLFEIIRNIKKFNQYDIVTKKIDDIFEKLLFDYLSQSTKLLKCAVLTAYENPDLSLDEIIRKVAVINNIKNDKTVHSSLDRCLSATIKRHKNLNDFSEILTRIFCYKPTTKNFINYMAAYLVKTYK